jgi:phosphatidylglycerophosphate synthase
MPPMAGQVKPWVTGADLVSALRLPLAALILVVRQPAWQLAIVAVAALSDVIDGALARRLGGSRIGAVLDPMVDKAFMAAAFAMVARRGVLEWYELAGVLLRDILAVLGFLATWVLRRPVALPARAGGKAVTVGQLLTLTAAIAESALVRPLAWATAAIAVYALWDYGRTAARIAADR